jgi:hypothetical protein
MLAIRWSKRSLLRPAEHLDVLVALGRSRAAVGWQRIGLGRDRAGLDDVVHIDDLLEPGAAVSGLRALLGAEFAPGE